MTMTSQLGGRAGHGPHRDQSVEAHKTEPDKNTYLTFKHSLPGADPNYDYGTHFLFQGHEGGAGGAGYITRINLDADAAHRVTLLATKDASNNTITTIDGSTWDPWAQRLLFTTESASAPTYAATPGYPSTVTDISGALGRGGYEGIQNDSAGDIWIVEDIGGSNKPPAGFATCTNGTPPPTPTVPHARSRVGRTASSTATSRPTRATWRTASCRCCRC